MSRLTSTVKANRYACGYERWVMNGAFITLGRALNHGAKQTHTYTDQREAQGSIHGDGDGLYLRVKNSGAASWVFIFKRAGVRKEMGLGAFMSGTTNIGLVEARARADAIRDQLSVSDQKPIQRAWRQDTATRRIFGQVIEIVHRCKAERMDFARSCRAVADDTARICEAVARQMD